MSKQMKTYWLINQYASTPETGMGGRHYYLAKELAKQGCNIYLIAASYTHLLYQPPRLEGSFKIESVDGFQFIWIKMPKYSDAHDKKRVLNWFIFSWKLLNLPKIIQDKPDAILVSSPSLVSFLGAQRLAKKFKKKLVFEVRDIWPLSLINLGGYSPRHPLIKLMQWIEDKAYQDADVVLSNLPYAVDHMVMRGMDASKFNWIPNGFDRTEVSRLEPLPETVLMRIPKNKFIIGYTGTLGVANAMDSLLDAAKLLKNQTDIVFIVVGNGKEKARLIKKSSTLSNVIFIDSVKKTKIPALLAEMDVLYVGVKDAKLYQFGIASNKLFEYLYSAKPIVYAIDSGKYLPVSDAKAGICIPPENPVAIVNAILELKDLSAEARRKMEESGREYALKNHDYAKIAEKLADILLEKKASTGETI